MYMYNKNKYRIVFSKTNVVVRLDHFQWSVTKAERKKSQRTWTILLNKSKLNTIHVAHGKCGKACVCELHLNYKVTQVFLRQLHLLMQNKKNQDKLFLFIGLII